jgi:hypothetical protein
VTGLVERLVGLADELDRRAAQLELDAQRVPVPGSETGRARVGVLRARASGLREAAAIGRAQAQALAQGDL